MKCETEINIREIQLEGLKILVAFDAVCRRHGLRYYLAYGTMLGAVRHKGFIPWDDDVDVHMPRTDYLRLRENCDKWLPEGMKFVDNTTDRTFPHQYGKIENVMTTYIERPYLGHYGGVWIDIFPLDGMIPDAGVCRRQKRGFKLLRRLQYYAYRDPWKHGRSLGGAALWLMQRVVKREWVNPRLERLMRRYDFDTTGHTMLYEDHYWVMPKSYFGDEPTEYEFEGRKFLGVADYDAYLSTIYGDYMTPPPEEKRVVEHNVVYCDLHTPVAEYIAQHVAKK